MNTHRENRRDVSFASDISTILDVLRKQAWVICGCVVIALALGVAYIRATPRVFAARAVIQVEQEGPDLMKVEGSRVEDLKAAEVVKTFEQSITSSDVLLRVVNDQALAPRPDFLPDVKRPASDSALQEALARKVKAKLRFGTRLIDVTVEDQNPALAKAIADTLVREFTAWTFEARRDTARSANHFLLEEADRMKARLVNAEQALHKYREENDAVSLEERQNIIVEKLRELNTRVTVAKAERLKLEADVAQLKSARRKAASDLIQVPAVASAADVLELNRTIMAKEATVAQLAQRYGARHHKMVEASREVERLKAELTTAARTAAEVLESTYEAALLNEQKLEGALREQERLALDLNRIAIPYSALVRNVEADRTMYNLVLTRLKETDLTKDIAQPVIRVVSTPVLPHRPIKPHKSLILVLCMLAGIAAGGAAAFGIHAADPSLGSARNAESLLGLKTLAEIARLHQRRSTDGKIVALPVSDPIAEDSFRALTSSFLLGCAGETPRSILFTSTQHGSGTTFCAAGSAISFANLGLRTLLVDSDRRAAGVRNLFFTGLGQSGNTNGGENEGQWEKQTLVTQIPNLSLLSIRRHTATDDKGRIDERFKHMLQWATSNYDIVIVDGAPVEVGSDTLHMARQVQAVCLVLQAERTHAEDAVAAARRLEETGAQVLGFVWNKAQRTAGGRRKRHLDVDVLYEELASSRLQSRITKAEPQNLSRIETGSGTIQTDRDR